MAIYELKDILANDFVIYPSNDVIQIKIGTAILATFKLMSTGGDYISKSNFYVGLFGGRNNLSSVTKYRLRPRFNKATIDGVPIGYDYLTYDIEYHTTVGSGDPGYTTGYFKMGAIEFKPNALKDIKSGRMKLVTIGEQKVSIIPRQMKTIDLNNSGTFKINNQTMSLK